MHRSSFQFHAGSCKPFMYHAIFHRSRVVPITPCSPFHGPTRSPKGWDGVPKQQSTIFYFFRRIFISPLAVHPLNAGRASQSNTPTRQRRRRPDHKGTVPQQLYAHQLKPNYRDKSVLNTRVVPEPMHVKVLCSSFA